MLLRVLEFIRAVLRKFAREKPMETAVTPEISSTPIPVSLASPTNTVASPTVAPSSSAPLRLEVRRFKFLLACTIGKLWIDDQDSGIYTLEDVVRERPGVPVDRWKVQDQTAIPRGLYSVLVDYSPHFKRPMPHITGVPGFSEIRIHFGNTDLQTCGCVLVGRTWSGGDFIGESRLAFADVFAKISAAKSTTILIS